MKKLFATLLAASLMLAGTQAFAQIAVGGGYLNATDKATVSSLSKSLDLNGIYAGVSVRFGLDDMVDGLGLAPGAYFNFLFGNDFAANTRHRDIALQVPINVTYGYELTDEFKLLGFAGPALQLGLVKKGVYKDNGHTDTWYYYRDDYSDTLGRFNLLLGLGAGFEVAERIQVVLGADFGLLNLYKDGGATYKRPSQIKIGINYIL